MIWQNFWLKLGINAGLNQQNLKRQSLWTGAMQSVVPKQEIWMTEMFPWIDKTIADKIVNESQKVPLEFKQKAQSEMYSLAIKQKETADLKKAREAEKNNLTFRMTTEKDPEVKRKMVNSLKVANLADMIKQKEGLPANAKDDEVINVFMNQKGERTKLFEDYMGWVSDELLYDGWLAKDPRKTGAIKAITARLFTDSWFLWRANKTVDKANVIWLLTQQVDDLAQKIPVISDKQVAEFLWGQNIWGEQMVANIPWSGIKLMTGILRWVTNPVDSAIWLTFLLGTSEGRQVLVDRYGSKENIQRTIQEDPIWFASDLMLVTQLWAGLLSKWSRMAGLSKIADVTSDASRTAWVLSDLWVPQWYWAATTKAISVAWDVPLVWWLLKKTTQVLVDITQPLTALWRRTGVTKPDVKDIQFTKKDWTSVTPKELLNDSKFVKLYDYISPKLTKTQENKITTELGREKTKQKGLFQPIRFVPNSNDVIRTEIAAKYTNLKEWVDVNLDNYKNWIKTLWNEIGVMVDDNQNIKYWLLEKKIAKIKKPIWLQTADWDRMVDAVRDTFYQILEDTDGTSNKDLYEARKLFWNWAEDQSVFKWQDTAMKDYIVSMGTAVNEYLWDVYWDMYTNKLKEQAILYTIIQDVVPKAPRVGTSKESRLIQKNKDLIKSAGYLAGLWYAGTLWITSLSNY